MVFNGRLKITVCGATGLTHTNFMTRLNLSSEANQANQSQQGGGKEPELDPYVAIDVDEVAIERTSTKGKTREPTWNETFTTDLLRNADEVGFTVWHDATMPPDDFIANCKVSLGDLVANNDEQLLHDLWVSRLNSLMIENLLVLAMCNNLCTLSNTFLERQEDEKKIP